MTEQGAGGGATAGAAPPQVVAGAQPQAPLQPAAPPPAQQAAAEASAAPDPGEPAIGAAGSEPALPHFPPALAKRRPGRPSTYVTPDGNPACQCCGADLTQGGHKSFHQVCGPPAPGVQRCRTVRHGGSEPPARRLSPTPRAPLARGRLYARLVPLLAGRARRSCKAQVQILASSRRYTTRPPPPPSPQRYHICEAHMMAPSVERKGTLQRFCQQ